MRLVPRHRTDFRICTRLASARRRPARRIVSPGYPHPTQHTLPADTRNHPPPRQPARDMRRHARRQHALAQPGSPRSRSACDSDTPRPQPADRLRRTILRADRDQALRDLRRSLRLIMLRLSSNPPLSQLDPPRNLILIHPRPRPAVTRRGNSPSPSSSYTAPRSNPSTRTLAYPRDAPLHSTCLSIHPRPRHKKAAKRAVALHDQTPERQSRSSGLCRFCV